MLQVSDPEAKWLVVERNGEALLLLCTWNPKPVELRVRFDTSRLDFAPKSVADAEAGSQPRGRGRVGHDANLGAPPASDLSTDNATDSQLQRACRIGDDWQWDAPSAALSLPIPGYGVRVVRLW